MKKRRILPLLMAAVLMTAGMPMTAGAAETSADAAQETTEQEAEGGVIGDSASTDGASEQAGSDSAAADGTESGAAVGDSVKTEEPSSAESSDTADTEEATTNQDEEGADKEDADEEKDNEVASDNVVTLGENLSAEQRAAMYSYFGVEADEVRTIIVTHADEVQYMEGIATDEQIGATTNSCAYVEPTESGGIKVKTANLNFVTSAMIASTLTTAGMENCNVVAACPFEVSGTGALTGIMMAYETASGESLDEGKKEAAVEELITTGALADTFGQETASEIMNDVKTEILDKGYTDAEEIGDAVDTIAEKYDAELTEEQRSQIVALMEKISQYDYDVSALKDTLDNLSGELSGLSSVWNSIKTFFVGSGDGILSETNDEALGENVITDSTVSESGFKDGLLTRIMNFFKGE
ncbi:DUF1002 domain-containing protein [Faecalimonas umbilicata]|nr:DUF1002 domain-containing protein [Faecalimonas umbilicata]